MKVYEASIQYSLVSDGKSQPLDAPEKVHLYMRDAFEKSPLQESVWVICLNRKNHPLARALVTLGSATNSIVNPPEIFRIAILAGATSLILVHNHPSGDPAPSAADIKVTRTIREAGKFMNIELLDHVVCGDEISDPNGKGYYSFNEAGLC